MTRASIQEYTEAVRGRYLQAKKKEKSQILDEFTKVIGYHRKAAIRLLHRGNQQGIKRKRGRPRQYGIALAEALRVVWEATDRLCSRRLHPFLLELVKVLRRHGNSTVMKLVTKTRHESKVHKAYYRAQTPYQRLLKAGMLTEAKRKELAVIYHSLNPVTLLKQINENLEYLWAMVDRVASGERNTPPTNKGKSKLMRLR